MKKIPKIKLIKHLFFFFLLFTIYFTFVWAILPIFTDPQINRFEEYNRLWNWDLKQHARGDFDNDGNEDLITFTGCAFLTSANTNVIPNEKRCTATGIVGMFNKKEIQQIGQKYIEATEYDLTLDLNDQTPISHSYLGKEKNDNWKIFINQNNKLRIYRIENNGQLSEINKTKLTHEIDEILYYFSRYFIILALPLMPLSFIFSIFFSPFRSINSLIPIQEIISLFAITGVLFHLWRKAERNNKANRHANKPQLQ